MKSFAIGNDFGQALITLLHSQGRVFAPQNGADGVCRLRPLSDWHALSPDLPFLPPKKYLFPPRERLWSLMSDEYRGSSGAEEGMALVGLSPCDLQGIAYLDRLFADDPNYQQRRRRTLLIGMMCSLRDDCFCETRQPLPCDLFVGAERLWCASAAGVRLAALLAGFLGDERDLELPALPAGRRAAMGRHPLEQMVSGIGSLDHWRQFAKSCLSCGACSAVCPTCTCCDIADGTVPSKTPERFHRWDTCVVPSQSRIAEEQDHSSDRAMRLRSRFEHKFLGVGSLRGEAACVGCGRCSRVCPVGISLGEIQAALLSEGST